MCDMDCAAGEVCTDGGCELDCGAGLMECGGACVDTMTTRTHCSGCGITCPIACSDGGCATVRHVQTGSLHTCAVLSTGRVRCWGDNAFGQLGRGTTTDSATPADVLGLTGVVAVDAGFGHTCARTTAGAIVCWGRNGSGELGIGFGADTSMPGSPAIASGAVQVSAGGAALPDGSSAGHTCARRTDGTLQCWGENADGQAGVASLADQSLPAVVPISDVLDVSAGGNHTCALVLGGAVRCWGRNDWNQLGPMFAGPRSATPITVLPNALEVEAGANGACAVRDSGGMACWGFVDYGDGMVGIKKDVASLAGFVGPSLEASLLAFGASHTCYAWEGDMSCFGDNSWGQIGDGTTTRQGFPQGVRGVSGAASGAAGDQHSCAVTSVGAAYCWGRNDNGQVIASPRTSILLAAPIPF
jgi:alpha-tubulin suppressor-like RCC1 family protein